MESTSAEAVTRAPTVLAMRDACSSIRERRILDCASLDVRPGSSVAIMGPSGSGKTTLLMALAGLIDLDAGRVSIDGSTVSELSSGRRAALRLEKIGFVFQFAELLPDNLAWENVALPVMLQGRRRAESRAEACAALEEVGIQHLAERRSGELSGGERQRVAVARALVTAPSIVLADEPTGALDDDAIDAMCELLFGLPSRRDCAVVVVTHNEHVAPYAERRLMLTHGALEPRA